MLTLPAAVTSSYRQRLGCAALLLERHCEQSLLLERHCEQSLLLERHCEQSLLLERHCEQSLLLERHCEQSLLLERHCEQSRCFHERLYRRSEREVAVFCHLGRSFLKMSK